MFITTSQGGYSRHGEQFARGSFLMVFSHNEHKWEEEANAPILRGHFADHGKVFDVAQGDGFVVQKTCQCAGSSPYTYDSAEKVPSYYLKYCPVHGVEYRRFSGDSRRLYACVRHVSLRQFGHFMMGTARIAGQSVTVSGAYGSDGLPMDYEKLTPAGREMLVEVPKELAEEFWNGGGHNSAGAEAPAMRKWALETFKGKE